MEINGVSLPNPPYGGLGMKMKDHSQVRSEEVAQASATKYLHCCFDILIRSVWSLDDTKEQDTLQ